MAIPVISNTTSVLGYRKGQYFEYQMQATNSPTSWTASGLPSGMSISARGVHKHLHAVGIDFGQRLLGLDVDESVHPVRDVHADRRGRAVVDVEAGVERLEGELRLVTGRSKGAGRAAAAGRARRGA